MIDAPLLGLLYDPSRHGKPRWYVRIKGRRARIEAVDCRPPFPGTKEAHAAYWAARKTLEGDQAEARRNGVPRDRSSLDWLIHAYLDSPTCRRLNPSTQKERKSVLLGIPEKDRAKPYPLMEPRHVVRLRDQKNGDSANRRVKCLRYMFRWAIPEGYAIRNPAKDVDLIRVVSEGFPPWQIEDVKAFEKCHAVGTKARLALALFLYTGCRRSDVVKFGPMTVRGDRLLFVEQKGKGVKPKRRNIPLVKPLREILDATHLGNTTWIENSFGKPFSVNGFGWWFRKRCDDAGLDGLSAHGIRKAVGIMAAERGCSAHQIMQILGHDTLEEAERYTRGANARKLGDAGFSKLFGTEQE